MSGDLWRPVEPYVRFPNLNVDERPCDDSPTDPPERSEAEDERQHRLYCQRLDRAEARERAAQRDEEAS